MTEWSNQQECACGCGRQRVPHADAFTTKHGGDGRHSRGMTLAVRAQSPSASRLHPRPPPPVPSRESEKHVRIPLAPLTPLQLPSQRRHRGRSGTPRTHRDCDLILYPRARQRVLSARSYPSRIRSGTMLRAAPTMFSWNKIIPVLLALLLTVSCPACAVTARGNLTRLDTHNSVPAGNCGSPPHCWPASIKVLGNGFDTSLQSQYSCRFVGVQDGSVLNTSSVTVESAPNPEKCFKIQITSAKKS